MMRTLPSDFSPPSGCHSFSLRITRADGRHEVSISALSHEELNWVARTVAAELALRYEDKNAGKTNGVRA